MGGRLLGFLAGFLRGAIRVAAFIIVTLVLVPLHYIVLLITGSLRVTRIWHVCVRRILGVQVDITGADNRSNRQCLYLSNHLSYADIFVIGGIRDLVFISKDDVRSWPVFGYLATLQKTVFIPRSRAGIEIAKTRILERMKQGYDLILFPEGTSTDGTEVKPFKRALVPFDLDIDIQPVAIAITHVDGQRATTQAQRDRYAWYGDMDFLPHLWGLFCGRSVRVAVHFLPIINAADFADEGALVNHAYQAVHTVLGEGA